MEPLWLFSSILFPCSFLCSTYCSSNTTLYPDEMLGEPEWNVFEWDLQAYRFVAEYN